MAELTKADVIYIKFRKQVSLDREYCYFVTPYHCHSSLSLWMTSTKKKTP